MPEFDFSQGTIDSLDFLTALCARRGVEADLADLQGIPLSGYDPAVCTERKIIGMIAGLYGKFAVIDREGVLRFRWYEPVEVQIDGDCYYEGGLEKAGFGFTVGWLKCFVEVLEETIMEGDDAAEQGIYFECPWMTEDRLAVLWEQVRAFTFHPVPQLSFFGDPRLDPGDVISLTDLSGTVVSVPIMTILHEFDGGIKTEITAQGQSKTDAYEGPIQRQSKRTIAKIIKKQKEIEISVAEAGGKISEILLDVDGIESKVASQEETVENIQQDMTVIRQTAESVSIQVQKIVNDGAPRVKTRMGYTFDDDGMLVEREGDQVANRIDNTGMNVSRSGEMIFKAGAEGVDATDVTVHNYLNMGEHARFEDYSDGTDSQRTACFWK